MILGRCDSSAVKTGSVDNSSSEKEVNAASSSVIASSSESAENSHTNIVSSNAADNKNIMVYITKSGTKYHKAGCSSLSKSCIPISLEEAKKKNYEPCKKCKPD